MQIDSPKQRAAQAYLRSTLARPTPGRLPTIAGCARSAGVSYVTMWKAFATLRDSGEMTKSTGERPPARPKTHQWQSIQERIIRDIVSGRHAAGGTLTLKGMVAEYGACYRTAKAAVDSLESTGWLVREKKQYRVRSPVTGGFGGTVVLLSTVNRTRSVATLSSRIQDLIRATEIHCSRMRLGLEPVFLRERLGTGGGLGLPSGPGIAGYLVWIGDLDALRVSSLLDQLARTGNPVALLDETGEVPPDVLAGAGAGTALFSLANSRGAGREMGRYLLGLGHRRIGFISVNQGQRWADNRFAGLCEVYAAAGLGDAVRFFGAGSDAPDAEMAALWGDALADPVITAWVTVTDALGIRSLTWLVGKGVRPGRDLSVAGFDDSPDAFLHGLTSYNFNCEATIHAMLTHLVGRRVPQSESRRNEALEIEGFITPRGSSGRARLRTIADP